MSPLTQGGLPSACDSTPLSGADIATLGGSHGLHVHLGALKSRDLTTQHQSSVRFLKEKEWER